MEDSNNPNIEQEPKGYSLINIPGVKEAVTGISSFLGKLLGPTATELGLWLGDNIRFRRTKNQLKILEEAQKICVEKNISVKQISLKTLVPLLENASLEEDKSLQAKWAVLLANMADDSREYESSIYSYILSQLSIKEAKALDSFWHRNEINLETFCRKFDLKGSNINNLIRLGLLERNPPEVQYHEGGESRYGTYGPSIEISDEDICLITDLAVDFLSAVSIEPPEKIKTDPLI